MNEKETPQVVVKVTTDLYYTAEFLRELANAIEDEGTDLTEMETANGMAEVEWPEEAYEETEEIEEVADAVQDDDTAERIRRVLMIVGDIHKAETALSLFGTPKFVDEKIDDGCDDGEDTYVMMRSYDVDKYYVRIYYGNNTGVIGCVDIDENE